jgi:outer membrane protein assembly factor BamB
MLTIRRGASVLIGGLWSLVACGRDATTRPPVGSNGGGDPSSLQSRGTQQWTASIVVGDVRPVRADSDLVLIDSLTGALVSRRIGDGRVQWQTGRVRPSAATIASGIAPPRLLLTRSLVVVVDSTVRAFDRGTGALRWTNRPLSIATSGVLLSAATRSALFVAGGAAVARVELTSGRVEWTTSVPEVGLGERGCSPLSFDADSVQVVVSLAGCGTRRVPTVVAINAATGAVLWRAGVPDSSRSRYAEQIMRAGSRTLVALDNAQLGALDLGGGDSWSGPTENAGLIAPYSGVRPFVIANGVVVSIGVNDVTGTDAVTGREQWRIRSSVIAVPARGGPLGASATRAYVAGSSGAIGSVSATGTWGWFIPSPTIAEGRAVYLLAEETDVILVTPTTVSRWTPPP